MAEKEQIFVDNPNMDVAYKTSDGKFFYLKQDAINHAKKLEEQGVEKKEAPDYSKQVEELNRDGQTGETTDETEGEEDPTILNGTVKEIASAVKNISDGEYLSHLIGLEEDNAKRSSVISILKNRIEGL